MLFSSLSVPLALLATLALSAPIEDSTSLIARALEKRTDYLIDTAGNKVYANPSLATLTDKKAVLGCFIPSKGYTIYFTQPGGDCAKFNGIKVYPIDAATT